MGQPAGFLWARPQWQWQPTLTVHDPTPPITLDDVPAPPAPSGGRRLLLGVGS